MTGLTVYTARGAVVMSPQQCRLYRLLAASPGRVVLTGELAAALGLPSGRAVDELARTMRLGVGGPAGIHVLANVWGVGWRLDRPAAATRPAPRSTIEED